MGLKDKDRVCKINKSTGIGRRKRGGSRGLWFLAPSLLGVGYLVLLPTGDVLRRSFTTALSGQWVGLENYGNVLTNSAFRLATGNTLVFLGICLPLLLALSLLLALVVCRIPRLERFKVLYLLPMAVPAATVVLGGHFGLDCIGDLVNLCLQFISHTAQFPQLLNLAIQFKSSHSFVLL